MGQLAKFWVPLLRALVSGFCLAPGVAPIQVRGVWVDYAVPHLWETLREVSLHSACLGTGSTTPSSHGSFRVPVTLP